MINKLNLLLGETADNYSTALKELMLEQATLEVKAYTNRVELDSELDMIVIRMAVIMLNRMNSEGLASQSYSGVSESYLDGFPANILAVLNRKRKVKVI